MRALHVAAIVATVAAVWTAASALRRPAPRAELGAKWPKPTNVVRTPCTIERAIFGGTEAAVLKIRKDRKLHYVVMYLPSEGDQPIYDWMVQQQDRWLKNEHGDVPPSALVGIYPTIEEAELKAGSLCRSN
jgi:hypothetical protein